MTRLPRKPAVLIVLAAALVVGACGAGGGDDSGADTMAGVVEDTGGDPGGGSEGLAAPTVAEADAARSSAQEVRVPAIISTGTVSLRSTDAEQARFDVLRVVAQHRGTVSEQETITSDDGDVEMARLVLRVPSRQFAQVMKALEGTAELVSTTSGSEDVTTQVIDTEVRIRAQEKSLERVEVLLARARTLQEIVAIEAQLTRRQADLDSLKSQQAWLEDQTSLATISVDIEQASEGRSDEAGGFLGGLRDGWNGLVAALGALATAVGLALPFLALLALLGVPLWLLVRNLRGRRTTAAAAPADPAG